jgi:phenylacetate-coenzyme A ligase PaaK-like adenylate-forming protein
MLLTERIAFIGATSGHFASIVTMQRLRQLNPWMAQCLRCFSILQPTSALVDELNAFAPTVIATYPTVAALLAELVCRGALHFVPKEIWTGGETLSAALRRRLQTTLRCTVRNSYGASEFMSIGWECRSGKMHANTDWVILEPVDERGQPVPAGHASYSTLLTNLANHVQPLIRYDLGDQITVHPEPCECGSSLPMIEVQGRRDDPLVMAGRDGKPVTLLPLALTTVLEDEAAVFDFQLIQRDDRTLVLRIDLHGAPAEATAARCRTVLQNFAVTQGVVLIRVLVELGQAGPKGRSGKAQRVVAHPGPKSP